MTRWRFAWAWFVGAVIAGLLLPAASCPLPDRDGDGVPDVIDQCPDVPGPIDNIGCPITPPEAYDCANPPALTGFVPVVNPLKDRYIVVRKAAARLSVASAAGFAARFNAQEVEYLNATTLSLKVAKDKLSALVADPEVQYLQQEGTKSTRISWGLDRVDAREGLDGKYAPVLSGLGIHAYINDTGISPHPDFEDRLSSECFSTIVLKGCEDGHGHGTHVAGTVAGKTWGVAKKVILHSARFLDSNGSGTDSDAIKSLDWIAAHQLPEGERGVVNASWGGSPAPAVDAAVCRVIEAGKVFMAAAGNESSDSRSSTPARIIQVVTVGAMDRDDRGASFTNYGPGVDLFAPGVDIESAAPGGGTATYSGTSMASPHVAGGAALYLESHRSATVAEVEAGLIAESTPDTLSGIGVGSPNRLLYVQPVGVPPETGSPKVVDGRWVPALRGAVNCCDFGGTPDFDEGIEDGWSLATSTALDRISGPGTVNWTHFRVGPFSDAAAGNVVYSVEDQEKVRYVRRMGLRWGTGPDMLPQARAALELAKRRGIWVEVDVVDNWALATSGMNYFGDDCSVTHAAPPERYLLWVDQVVEATWDLAAMYNLGNEGFRCRPVPEWETGLRDRLVSALAAHGVTRPIGNNVKLGDLRVVLDYRTYHGFEPIPVGMTDIPTMLTETDNRSHSVEEWVALAGETEARGGYLAVWRGPDSWDVQNGVLNSLPKLGEPWPPPPPPPPPADSCPKALAPGSVVYMANGPYGQGFDSTVRVKGDPEFCRLIHGVAVNDCHLESWPTRVQCEMQLIDGCPIWQFTPDSGTNVYSCVDDQTALSSCDHFGDPVNRDDPQTPTTGDTLETLRGFEGRPLACGLQRDAHGPMAGFFAIAHGTGKLRACKPDGQGCGSWKAFDH